MKHRLQSKEGKAIYAQRKSTVEPVFGIIKHIMGFRQFMLRGLEKVKGEWNLVCISYNLKRLHTITGQKRGQKRGKGVEISSNDEESAWIYYKYL